MPPSGCADGPIVVRSVYTQEEGDALKSLSKYIRQGKGGKRENFSTSCRDLEPRGTNPMCLFWGQLESPADPGFRLISSTPKPENRMKTYLKFDLTQSILQLLMLFDENPGSGFMGAYLHLTSQDWAMTAWGFDFVSWVGWNLFSATFENPERSW